MESSFASRLNGSFATQSSEKRTRIELIPESVVCQEATLLTHLIGADENLRRYSQW
jgi:hypothetical protein